jgi:hypothetical protein
MAPAFDLVFASSRGGKREVLFKPDQGHGTARRSPVRAFTIVVLLQAPTRVVGYADIERGVSASEDVAIKHRRHVPLLGTELCPSAGSGQNLRGAKILEAGGVEPPSEEAHG